MLSRKVAMVGIAAGAAVLLAVPNAWAAATTYKITAGTHASGSAAYTAKTATGTAAKPAIAFTDTTKKQNLGCVSGSAAGKITLGAKVPAKLGSITKTGWVKCKGPNNLVLIPKQAGSWVINGTGKTVKGVTHVVITKVNASVADSGGSLCTFTVTGAVDGNYNNATHKLTIASTKAHKLAVSKADCFGLIANKDNVTFRAAYTVSSTLGVLAIKSN